MLALGAGMEAGAGMRGRRAGTAACLAALWIPVAAAADVEPAGRSLPGPRPDLTITIGAEGRVEPAFQGSKQYGVRPHPLFDARPICTPGPIPGPPDGIGAGPIQWAEFPDRSGRPTEDGAPGRRRSGRAAWARRRALGGRGRHLRGVLVDSLAAHAGGGSAGVQRSPWRRR